MATALKAGDVFPQGVTFKYIPYAEDQGEITACGIPIDYDASKEFAARKVVLVSVPGAFTPTCQKTHLAGYLARQEELKSKGVDHVIVIAYNDPFVMSAWGKANGVKDNFVVDILDMDERWLEISRNLTRTNISMPNQQLFMSDTGTAFSQSIGWTAGERTGRYAMLICNGKVLYAEKEEKKEVTVSGVDAVIAKL
ncbi:putative peroxisomal membrane protein [Zalerion maritima]|uniref:Peroxisomal membrane protein n=1 Tax=Zalerion maritima TaxID=339359 RepID=A0AAD5RL41_9PEZI|nr:putative peroxisomal membrane protein [Zalerion maritima]